MMIFPTTLSFLLLVMVTLLFRQARGHARGCASSSGNTQNNFTRITGFLSSIGFLAMAIAYGSLGASSSSSSSSISPSISLVPTTTSTTADVSPPHQQRQNCVYVPGAGFSGFFYTLGWLQCHTTGGITESATTATTTASRMSMEKRRREEEPQAYYCYSAGCLVATALLLDIPPTQLFDLALTTRQKWNHGKLSRFDFVKEFVQQLLKAGGLEEEADDDRLLGKLVIITSTIPTTTTPKGTSSGRGILQTSTRSPTTLKELQEMLIQTTWIPGITGNSLTYEGHFDGAFTAALSGNHHPTCPTIVNLPDLSWQNIDFFANTMNMNLQLHQFWQFLQLGQTEYYNSYYYYYGSNGVSPIEP